MDEAAYARLETADASLNEAPSKGEVGQFAATANIANVVIGAGVLALPFAYARSGTAGGPFLSLWWLVDGIVCVMMLGLAASYVIVFGNLCSVATSAMLDGAPKAVRAIFGSRESWVTVAIFVVAPMAYQKSLDLLKYTSTLGLVFMLYVAALVAAGWADKASVAPCLDDAEEPEAHCGGAVKPLVVNLGTLEALALSTFSYTAQTQALRDYTQARMDACIVASVAICGALYCLIGHAGFETFGQAVNSDLLESYHASPEISVARFAISFVVAFSYPLMCMPFRNSSRSLLENQTRWPRVAAYVAEHPDRYHYATSSFFIAFTYVVALFVSDLGVILSLIGATAATAIAYIIPCTAYVLRRRPPTARALLAVVGAYGVVVMPFCVASTFIKT
ncbi:hypothetical protein JL722_1490 [Aureococcus anophagefferens]|nr:hypothetical protein JL722_1490 [Aureococcus anophagefferens]